MLEVHLNTSYDVVDHLVLTVGAKTFTGLPKPLRLKESLPKFSSYSPNTIYHELTYPPKFHPQTTWNIEDFQHNALLTQALPAWRCSSCFGTIETFLNMISSFSHVGLNAEVYRDRERIVDRVSKGKDLWVREGETFVEVEGNEDVPGYLEEGREERERFGYMVDRRGEGAGFRDWEG
ncbi:hypothetical protein B0T14DRAFT_597493 [Immersiella caudata]|uniref:Uncharacterized protein n=1 Tax=Immersiella caudata TaxID=314043 RepID=A0AA39XDG5_9PEZI|nr:hypothetical protein B0T14DRAFT_597493 [Immersiella caudata]